MKSLGLLLSLTIISFFTLNTFAGAPGAPGMRPNWSSAKKVQVGTSFSGNHSLVWFTNTQGVLTETYFPTIDKAQIKDAGFLITDGKSFFVEERTGTEQTVEVISPSLVKLINRDKLGKFTITHTFYTASNSSTLIDEVEITSHVDGLQFYLLVNPAINNTGFMDSAKAFDDKLLASEGDTILEVKSTSGFSKTSVGYVGVNDGWQDLSDNFQLDYQYDEALHGNVALTGQLAVPAKKGHYKFHISYNFQGSYVNGDKSLADEKERYELDWQKYFSQIKVPKNIREKDRALYLRSLYVLRVHEDKLNPGAMIASLSKPWGETTYEYPGVFTGGYHLVWPRDLFHVSLALIKAGDLATAERALNFLKKIQYDDSDGVWNFNNERIIRKNGAFPQNVWMNGNDYWSGLQLDQVGYPVQLFYHLYSISSSKKRVQLLEKYGDMVYRALEFIKVYGPWSAQERWEENFGISPSTFSVATTALIVGHKIFGKQEYLNIANTWLTKPNDNIHTWTFTTNGKFGDGQYYVRVGGCAGFSAEWNPNNRQTCTVSNSGQRVEQTELVDQGFLKLSLMGLVPANDWRILTSLDKVNQFTRKTLDGYSAWYRYTFDAYGENKKGRLWPLLSGEHGRFAIERYKAKNLTWKQASGQIENILNSYHKFANDGDMIPEQVFEDTFEGTGAATPLAWSHAEYIKLLWSYEHKHNVENLLAK